MQKTSRLYLSYLKYFHPVVIIAFTTIYEGDTVPIAQQLNDYR